MGRIDALNPTLHAYLTVTHESALAEATSADAAVARGDERPLLGVPLAVKDIVATAGIRTTAGSRQLWDWIPASDAECVKRMRSAGAVLLGKLTLHEFAYGWPVEDGELATGRNPWNLAHIPGGSSSGCGVAIAAGLASVTIGTDTGGSIRAPSNNCGISGVKPTNGLVSLGGVIPLAWSMDTLGPMCHDIRDAALALQVLVGHDPSDPLSSARPVPDYTAELDAGLHGVRVGVPAESLYAEHSLHPEIGAAIAVATKELSRNGGVVREVELPVPSRWQAIVNTTMVEAYAYHAARLKDQPEGYSTGLRQRLLEPSKLSAADLANAYHDRHVLAQEMRVLFGEVDVLIMPVEFHLPLTFADSDAQMANLTRPPSLRSLWNLVGQPSLAIPCGFSTDGLPIGMQVVGRAFDEVTLFRVAASYQLATDWHTRRPPLGD